MLSFLAPTLLMLFLLTAWLALRPRPRSVRVAGAAVTWLGLSAVLWSSGISPLLSGPMVPMGPDGHWLRAVGIAWWLLAARLLAAAARWLLQRNAKSHEALITADLVSGLTYVAAFGVILNFVLLLPVGGLITTSGVVAVVIGLALQNTLADVFSGIAVGIEGPFAPGDRITLADGIEGKVVETNWRSVRIATDSGDLATVPNSLIAKAQIINRSVPVRRRAGSVSLIRPAHDRPEEILTLLDRAAILSSDVLTAPAPVASMERLGSRTATYTLSYQVADTPLLLPARTKLLAQIHLQLRLRELADLLGDPDELSAARALVAQLPLFASLSPGRRDAIAAKLSRRALSTGDTVFAKGTDADTLVLIADGIVAVTAADPDEASDPLRHAGPGEVIGDIGLVGGDLRPYTGRAASTGLIFLLARADLLALIAEDAGFATALEASATSHVDMLRRTSDHDTVTLGRLPHFIQALRRILAQEMA